jgi:hypothetical protein
VSEACDHPSPDVPRHDPRTLDLDLFRFAMSALGRRLRRKPSMLVTMGRRLDCVDTEITVSTLGAVALAAIEDDELRHLDVATTLAQSEALLAATPLDAIAEERRSTSGFVEQQRLFARTRR